MGIHPHTDPSLLPLSRECAKLQLHSQASWPLYEAWERSPDTDFWFYRLKCL